MRTRNHVRLKERSRELGRFSEGTVETTVAHLNLQYHPHFAVREGPRWEPQKIVDVARPLRIKNRTFFSLEKNCPLDLSILATFLGVRRLIRSGIIVEGSN